MIDIGKLFDSYNRQARLYPALLALLPALALALATWPHAILGSVGSTIVSIAVTCGLIYFLADLARSAGKALEPSLLQSWGGWPTTLWLRHSSSNLPRLVKERYHAFLSGRAIPGKPPTVDEEKSDPKGADELYDGAVIWLKEQAREDRLVKIENATYGFRRNLLGLRPVGLSISAAALVGSALEFGLSNKLPAAGLGLIAIRESPALVGSMAFALLACVAWVAVIQRSWVRAGADQYARALLSCCDKLAGQTELDKSP